MASKETPDAAATLGLSTLASVEDQASSAGDTLQRIPTVMSTATVEIINDRPIFRPTRDFVLAFSALCVLGLACAFDATTLSVALPTMSATLGGTALEAFWSGTSFLLASTVLQPTVASLSNIFGRKLLIYLSSALFAAGSLVAALAGNFGVILAGRTVQGIGGGGLLALTEVVITDLVPLAFRGHWLSMLSGVWSIGTVTGPLIGAGFAQDISWRWIFYINLPVIAVGVVFVALFLHQTPIPGDIMSKLRRFDWLGSVLFTVSSTGFLFGLTTGGVMYEWGSWRVLLPLIIGPCGLFAFAYWEFRFASEPIINKGVFNNWDMVSSYAMTMFHGMILWSILYFLILYYQGVKLYSPVISAVACLPETLTVAPSGLVVGIIAAKTGHYRWSIWIGWALTTLGAGILLLLDPETSTVAWVFLNVPIGIGTGMLFPAMALSIQAASEPALNGEAAAFFVFMRSFGQAVGVAVSGVIFQNVFRQKLLGLPEFAGVAGKFSREATIVVEIIKAMEPGPQRSELMNAYNSSLRAIYVSMIAFAGSCLVLSASVKGYSLQQEHVTKQGLVQQAHLPAESGEAKLGAAKV